MGVGGRRVGVIGAGVAGLVSAKVLQDDGFDVTVFEKASTVGGVWSPSRAYAGLRTNNPRETYAFSDFPHPAASDEFPTAGQVYAYLEAYAEHFGVRRRVRLSTEVTSVSRRTSVEDGPGAAFRVVTRPAGGTGAPATHLFHRVVVCNGVFSEPHMPQVPGSERFKGLRLHSSHVMDTNDLRGRRVVVVGVGKSALDGATIAAQQGDSCLLVYRRPHWVLPRYFFGRLRVDRVVFTRLSEWLLPERYAGLAEERGRAVRGSGLVLRG
jgi:dimethylaniline monooxygenase (N-oxide forming)